MTEIIAVSLILISFTIGVFLTRFVTRRELHNLKKNALVTSSENEELKITLATQAREFSLKHIDQLKFHAAELENIRQEQRLLSDTQDSDARQKLRAAEDKAFNEGARQAELRSTNYNAGFSVQIRPYVAKIKKTNILIDDFYSAVGFQYQLFVNGIPCFQPHIVIEQESKETVINDERLKFLTEQAVKVAQLALQSTKSLDVFKFVDSPLIAEQEK